MVGKRGEKHAERLFVYYRGERSTLLETAHNDLWRKQKKGDKHANFLLWQMRLSDR